jgi:hypothetical protein
MLRIAASISRQPGGLLLGAAPARRGLPAKMHRATVAARAEQRGAQAPGASDAPGPILSAPNPASQVEPDIGFKLSEHVETLHSVVLGVDDTEDCSQAVQWALENLVADKGAW